MPGRTLPKPLALTRIAPGWCRAGQRGLSLIFAMMALVMLSLAAVALLRSVDVSSMIVGNLSFKQDATSASGSAAAEALVWLQAAPSGSLDADIAASGYYANSQDGLDPTGRRTSSQAPLALVDWFGDGSCSYAVAGTFSACTVRAKQGTPVNGNQVRWVITRLCKTSAAISSANPCAKPATISTANASERGEVGSGGRLVGLTSSPYYRIIVRTDGARNTVSYTETLVHF
jgi:Tfp pilus assembly protein PilX